MGVSRQDRKDQIMRSYIEDYDDLRRLAESQALSWDLAADQVQDFYLHWLQLAADSPSHPREKKTKPWTKRGVWCAGLARHRRRESRDAAEAMHRALSQPAEEFKSGGRGSPLAEMMEEEERERKEKGPGLIEIIRFILRRYATDRVRLVWRMTFVEEWSFSQIAKELGISENTARNDMDKAKDILRVKLPLFGYSGP